jgi:MFS-type transporter involved in bile tolerance (Atg22 family)
VVPPGMNIISCGFREVFATASRIRSKYKSLQWLLLSIMFAESGTSALITISTTYMTQVLGMTSAEIGPVFLVVLIMGVPGSKLGGFLAKKFQSPLASAKLCNAFFILATTWAALALEAPRDKHKTVFFGALWGLGLGWLSPMHTTSFIALMPKGSEAELMGNYLGALASDSACLV